MKRVGRPPTPRREQVTVVRLRNKHVGMLDEAIRREAESRYAGLVSADMAPPEIDYSRERRELVTRFIENELRDDLRHPTQLRLLLPRGHYTREDEAEIRQWRDEKLRELARDAPLPLQLAIEEHRLSRLRAKMPRSEYLALLDRITAGVD